MQIEFKVWHTEESNYRVHEIANQEYFARIDSFDNEYVLTGVYTYPALNKVIVYAIPKK